MPVALALGYFLDPLYAAILAGYFVNNLAYSFKVKNLPYVDVLSIALHEIGHYFGLDEDQVDALGLR